MLTIDSVLNGLQRVRSHGSGRWMALCPCHTDSDRSLSITLREDKILARCFGCGVTLPQVARNLGLYDGPRKVFQSKPKAQPRPEPQRRERITVTDLAEHKRLPVEMLTDVFWLSNGSGWVNIPFYDQEGNELYVKRRVGLSGHQSRNPRDVVQAPYSLWRNTDWVVFVEGESDVWTLAHYQLPAIGIPGAEATGCLEKHHLNGISRVQAVQEPDEGGKRFIGGLRQRLKDIGWHGAFRWVQLPVKDVSEAHLKGFDVVNLFGEPYGTHHS